MRNRCPEKQLRMLQLKDVRKENDESSRIRKWPPSKSPPPLMSCGNFIIQSVRDVIPSLPRITDETSRYVIRKQPSRNRFFEMTPTPFTGMSGFMK
ncbi:hypothetical protein CDAR_308721 [Caerostris darwini]|uniref:Uncharacterized protein n=1 Tax=Caerostris darwini TaxID=1538125 RepID=A0AAV4NVZ0_9ARAC|nr:hypothetical protein CDAR_308721 [Caerostris darwini]